MTESNIRYYMGRIKLENLFQGKKKGIYKSLEYGFMGNAKCGWKLTYPNELNIIPTRICRKEPEE